MMISDTNFREVVKTLFSVGLGIHVHKDLRLSISYDKIMKNKNDLGNAAVKNILLNHRVFVPPNVQPYILLHFPADNTDFKNDTPDQKSEFHGTTLVIFQKYSKFKHELLKIRQSKSFTFQHISIS